MGCAAISPRPRGRTCAGVGISPKSPPTKANFRIAAVLDLHSRRCVGFAMGIHHDAELARAALCVAIAIRGGAVAGVLFHTDQGGEYTGNLFVERVPQRRGHPVHGTHRIGAGQRGLGIVQLDPGVRVAAAGTTSPPASRRDGQSPRSSTNTTPTEGIPPTACSVPVTTNAPARRNEPVVTVTGSTAPGGRHEPRGAGSPPLSPPRPAPRKATGPSLRPQGSLPRSHSDGPAARP